MVQERSPCPTVKCWRSLFKSCGPCSLGAGLGAEGFGRALRPTSLTVRPSASTPSQARAAQFHSLASLLRHGPQDPGKKPLLSHPSLPASPQEWYFSPSSNSVPFHHTTPSQQLAAQGHWRG